MEGRREGEINECDRDKETDLNPIHNSTYTHHVEEGISLLSW